LRSLLEASKADLARDKGVPGRDERIFAMRATGTDDGLFVSREMGEVEMERDEREGIDEGERRKVRMSEQGRDIF